MLRDPRSARIARLVGAAALALSIAACAGSDAGGTGRATDAAERPEADPIAVEVRRAERAPLSETYSTSATLRAEREATVIARTRGVVRELLVEEGDRVEQGRPLARLEDDEQRIELERARSSFEIETRDLERARELHDAQLLSHEEFETARREHEEARHAHARAELELSRATIRAPFTGRILRRHLDAGATVADGTAVYDLADLEPLHADVNVPERHVARLAPGQAVRLVADASGEAARATIERIAPVVDAATGTVKVTLAVRGDERLRPGAFVRAEVVTATRPDALVVPRSALVAEGRRWHVFRFDREREAVAQLEVRVGFEEGELVEIGEVLGDATLDPGDEVVVVGAAALSDGARVRVLGDGEGTAGASAAGPA